MNKKNILLVLFFSLLIIKSEAVEIKLGKGVSKVIPGVGIIVSPIDGKGDITITGSGGSAGLPLPAGDTTYALWQAVKDSTGILTLLASNTNYAIQSNVVTSTRILTLLDSNTNYIDTNSTGTIRAGLNIQRALQVGASLQILANSLPKSSPDTRYFQVATDTFAITSQGFVGIGTNTPNSLLHIRSLSNIDVELLLLETVNPTPFKVRLSAGGNQSYIIAVANSDEYFVGTLAGDIGVNTNRFVSGSGSVMDFVTDNILARTGLGTNSPSSRLDINGGSMTIRGTNAGIVVDTYTVRGTPLIVSTRSVRQYDGYVMYVTSGSAPANTTITIDSNSLNAFELGIPLCGELEDVNTAGVSVRVKSLSGLPASFTVYNADIVNSKNFICHVPGRPR